MLNVSYRDGIIAKAKKPGEFKKPKQVFAAWVTYKEYLFKGMSARARWISNNSEKDYARYEAFMEIAEAWEIALDEWFFNLIEKKEK